MHNMQSTKDIYSTAVTPISHIHCYFHCKRNMTPNKLLIYACAHYDCDYLRKIFSIIWCVILCYDTSWHLLWCRIVTGARRVAVLVTEGSFARSRSCTRTAVRSFSSHELAADFTSRSEIKRRESAYVHERDTVDAGWFGKPDTSGWEIYPNMFARRRLWSILSGELHKNWSCARSDAASHGHKQPQRAMPENKRINAYKNELKHPQWAINTI